MHKNRVVINALSLHASRDAARVFLLNLLKRFPAVWPEADFLVLCREGQVEELARIPGIRPISLGGSTSALRRVTDELTRVSRVINELNPDVLVSPNESVPVGVTSPLIVVAQNLAYHCPTLGPLTTGGVFARLRSRCQFAYYRWLMPRAYAQAAAVITVSEHAATELAEHAGLDPARVKVVPYGVDRLPLLPRKPPGSTLRLICVGALAPYKRIETVIDALGFLRSRNRDFELHLVGRAWPGYLERLKERARTVGVLPYVHLRGELDDDHLAELYASTHALVALSSCETFGLPVAEAMRAGIVAIVADEPWSRLPGGEAALRVSGSDPAAVASAVLLLDDHEEYERRSSEARRWTSQFSWDRNAAEIAAVVAHIANRRTLSRAGR